MKEKKLKKWVNEWWNTKGRELRDFLADLSGDKSFHEKLHVTDIVNIYNFAKSCKVQIESDSENYLLKEICVELAENVLASKHGVSTNDLFDEDGSFYEQYQDEFDKLYDQIEGLLSVDDEN